MYEPMRQREAAAITRGEVCGAGGSLAAPRRQHRESELRLSAGGSSLYPIGHRVKDQDVDGRKRVLGILQHPVLAGHRMACVNRDNKSMEVGHRAGVLLQLQFPKQRE